MRMWQWMGGVLLGASLGGCFGFEFGECFIEFPVCDGEGNLVFDCSGTVERCDTGICTDGLLGGFCLDACGDTTLAAGETCEALPSLFGGAFPEGCDPVSCQTEETGTCGNDQADPGELCFSPLGQLAGFDGGVDAILDLNGEGSPDLLAGEQIFLNNGAGLFSAPVAAGFVPVPEGTVAPRSFVGDFANDGEVDFVRLVGSELELIARRTGQADERSVFTTEVNLLLLGVAELTGDGREDLLARDGSAQLLLLESSGAGFFAPVVIAGPGADLLTSADLDGDGDRDLLVGVNGVEGFDRGQPLALRNNGAGFFTADAAPLVEITELNDADAVDLNEDGALDLVLTRATIGVGLGLTVLQNDGLGGFAVVQEIEQAVGISAQVGDYDGDTHLDIAVVGGNGAVYRNAAGALEAPQFFTGFGSRHASADLNGDGRADWVIADGVAPTLLADD